MPEEKVNSNDGIQIPVSLRTIGKITLRHGGTTFEEAIGYRRDGKGIVLQADGRRVLFDGQEVGSEFTKFKYEDDGKQFTPGSPTGLLTAIVDPTYDPVNTRITQSYTKGIIAIQSNIGNGALLGVLQDSTLPSSNDIQVLATIRRLPVTPQVSTIDLTQSVTCQNEIQAIASIASASTRSNSEPRCKSQVNPLPAPSSNPILTIDPKL